MAFVAETSYVAGETIILERLFAVLIRPVWVVGHCNMTPAAVFLRMAENAYGQVSHAVSLRPVLAMGNSPGSGVAGVSLYGFHMAKIAFGGSGLLVVTSCALVHAGDGLL